MFRFGTPYAFFLLLPLALAAWCVYRRRIRTGLLFAPTSRLSHATSWRMTASLLIPGTVLAGLALVIIALARPQNVTSRIRRSSDVIGINMVVDVSGSMEALDLSVKTATGTRYRTRLDAVKETFAEFIKQRPGDLIGLVSFGGYATSRAPLTLDHQALLHVLEGVKIPTEMLDEQGGVLNQEELLTAIGDALATACARLEAAEPESKIIVLLSDGESNTGIIQPEEAMKIARSLGIKVYTIGVGTSGRAPFYARDLFGRKTVRYANVSLDEEMLRKIATETGGRYFNVRDPEGLQRALDDINTLETTRVERDVFEQYHELFPRFLAPGLGLLVLGVMLNMMIVRRLI